MDNVNLNLADEPINPVDESTIDGGSSHDRTAKTGTAKYEASATKHTHDVSIIAVHNSTSNVLETERR
jgi:hypothetical protein